MSNCKDELEEWATEQEDRYSDKTFEYGYGLGFKLHTLIFIAPILGCIGALRWCLRWEGAVLRRSLSTWVRTCAQCSRKHTHAILVCTSEACRFLFVPVLASDAGVFQTHLPWCAHVCVCALLCFAVLCLCLCL